MSEKKVVTIEQHNRDVYNALLLGVFVGAVVVLGTIVLWGVFK